MFEKDRLKRPDLSCLKRYVENSKIWHVYIGARQRQLYTGIITDLKHRMKQHNASLLCSESFDDKKVAARREKEVKGCRRSHRLCRAWDIARRVKVPMRGVNSP
jgi:predicted GIY-YIG superfamily endonuclease